MWGWVLSIAARAVGITLTSSGDLANTTAQDQTVGLFTMIQSLGNFLQRLLSDEMVAWKKAGPDVIQAGRGLGNLAYNERKAWWRLLNVIIPNSLGWLERVIHDWAGPRFDRIWRFLSILDRRVWSLLHWRTRFANPWIWNYRHFRAWFYGWPYRDLGALHRWLTEPHTFAKWAVPRLVPRLLWWFSPPRHRDDRDALTRALVRTTPNVHRDVERAALAILRSPWP